jgi:hypothetical protein
VPVLSTGAFGAGKRPGLRLGTGDRATKQNKSAVPSRFPRTDHDVLSRRPEKRSAPPRRDPNEHFLARCQRPPRRAPIAAGFTAINRGTTFVEITDLFW